MSASVKRNSRISADGFLDRIEMFLQACPLEIAADLVGVNVRQTEEQLDVRQVLEQPRRVVLQRIRFHRREVLRPRDPSLESGENRPLQGPAEELLRCRWIEIDEVDASPQAVAVKMVRVSLFE